jgi:hypothetical protein
MLRVTLIAARLCRASRRRCRAPTSSRRLPHGVGERRAGAPLRVKRMASREVAGKR